STADRRKEPRMARLGRAVAGLAIVVAALGASAACTDQPATPTAHRPAVHEADSAAADLPAVFQKPAADPALTTLVEVDPTRGNATVGTVSTVPGEVWIDLNCSGNGNIAVTFEPLDTFTVACDGPALLTRNQLNLTEPHRLTI